MRHLFAVCLFAMFAVVGCGGGSSGDDDNPAIDAPSGIDAPPVTPDAASGTNALGQVCPLAQGGGGTMCPAGNTCVGLEGIGSQTTGYCSPMCNGNTAVCTAGYTGPAGGMPQCALTPPGQQTPVLCAIVCSDANQCPTGLTCQPVPGQAVMVCAAPV